MENKNLLKVFLVRENSGWNPTFKVVVAMNPDKAFDLAVEGEYFSEREYWSVEELVANEEGIIFSGELG